MRTKVYGLTALIVGAVLGLALGQAFTAMRQHAIERAALTCARDTLGTDSEIADCYLSRNLPLPGGIN